MEKHFEEKLLEQRIKVMEASVKRLKRRASFGTKELLQKKSKWLMVSYSDQNFVERRSVWKPTKSGLTQFGRTDMYISMTILKLCLRELSRLDHVRVYLRRNWTKVSDHSSDSGIDIGTRECVVPLDPFPLLFIGIKK